MNTLRAYVLIQLYSHRLSRQWLALGTWMAVAVIACSGQGEARRAAAPVGAAITHQNASTSRSTVDPPTQPVGYEVVRDEVYDVPLKTQVLEHGHVLEVPTEQQLRALLIARAESVSHRTGFRYHPSPTNIGVYIYETVDQARARQPLWLGMLFWRPEDGPPEITINQNMLANAGQGTVKRFSLTEAQRREIYTELVRAEDRGQAEAERQHPVKDGASLKEYSAQHRLANQLEEHYVRELARRYHVTAAVRDSIGVEALERGWPQPPIT